MDFPQRRTQAAHRLLLMGAGALAYSALHGSAATASDALEAIRRDRAWNDEAARKQLLRFFEAWGMVDPATLKARRGLSALLFR